jgi:MORN repeat variant
MYRGDYGISEKQAVVTEPFSGRSDEWMMVFCISRKYPTRMARYARILSADGIRWIKHGLFIAHHPNGMLSSEGMYVNGQEHGLWTEYHSNGQMAARGHYANGKEVGHWEFWSSDGSPEEGEDYPLPD